MNWYQLKTLDGCTSSIMPKDEIHGYDFKNSLTITKVP